MKTCCPNCRTIFRVSSEQIRVRGGKVRCGACRTVFNAIDSLLDDDNVAISVKSPPDVGPTGVAPAPAVAAPSDREEGQVADLLSAAASRCSSGMPPDLPARAAVEAPPEPPSASLAADQIRARDTPLAPDRTRILPAHSPWREGLTGRPAVHSDRGVTRTFVIVAAILAVMLAGQLVFHFRSAIASAAPTLQPALAALSAALGSELPLPRHADLVSIETSDLQSDPARQRLLVLQATLRNRAAYAQAYPALELTLTDTKDKAIARRVLLPDEYLPPASLEQKSFAAHAEVDLRLWLEAKDLSAAGYRLYVFYP